jgi:hypothetical protein
MESFFAVIIWIASLVYADEDIFRAKPLALTMLGTKKIPADIINAKDSWFGLLKNFKSQVTDHFEKRYRKDTKFLQCVLELRQILFPDLGEDAFFAGDLDEGSDPMKEGVFRQCMEQIDGYLEESKGSDEMRWIDSHSQCHKLDTEGLDAVGPNSTF